MWLRPEAKTGPRVPPLGRLGTVFALPAGMRLRLRRRKTEGHHWKLMTTSLAALTAAGVLAIMGQHMAMGVALVLGALTLAVQWLCIDPPYVDDEADIHGPSRAKRALRAAEAARTTPAGARRAGGAPERR